MNTHLSLPQVVAGAIGTAYLSLAVLGLIPPVHERWLTDAPHVEVRNGIGYIFGVIPANLPLTSVHLFTGLAGLASVTRHDDANRFLRVVAVGYGLLAVAGLLPMGRTAFGLMPLFGVLSVIHGATALTAVTGWQMGAAPRGRTGSAADGGRVVSSNTVHGRPSPRGTPSTATIAGRPIHPLLNAYPIALLTAALVSDIAVWWSTLDWYTSQADFWARASLWLIGSGTVLGVIAAIPGVIDFLALERVRTMRRGRIHGLAGVIVLILSTVNVQVRLNDPHEAVLPWGIVLSVVTAGLIAALVWSGSHIVYRDHIGPDQPSAQHLPPSGDSAGGRSV